MRSVERHGRRRSGLLAVTLFAGGLVLSACSTPIADMQSSTNPADPQSGPRGPGGYLPVNEPPPVRDTAIISPEERAKIEKELTAARDRQASTSTKDAGR